ncbi:MAG: EF-hand domain-containing protein [Verrucomicrobiae bacterium]|nr:EF-hand domain-containing protein [Verrucomicrobiae bacterium]
MRTLALALSAAIFAVVAANGMTESAFAAEKKSAKAAKLCAELKATDDDTDGELDMAEAKASATKVFKKLDKNNDGKLDAKEFKGRLTKKEFEAANPDKDKTIELPEWLALAEARFKAANPDGDVTLECDELQSKKGKAFLKIAR